MSTDELRILSSKSRMVERVLQQKRAEISEIHREVKSRTDRIAASSEAFRRMRTTLREVGGNILSGHPKEALERTKKTVSELKTTAQFLENQQAQLTALKSTLCNIEGALHAGNKQIEILSSKSRKICRDAAEKVEQGELDDTCMAAKCSMQHSSDRAVRHEGSSHHLEVLCHSAEQKPAPELVDCFRQPSQDAHAPMLQTRDSQTDSRNTFRSALSPQMLDRVEQLKRWDRADEQGVTFQVKLGSSREIEVEVAAHSQGGLRVSLESTAERDRRQLWETHRALQQELSNAGFNLRTVQIKRRVPTCR